MLSAHVSRPAHSHYAVAQAVSVTDASVANACRAVLTCATG